MVSLFQRLPLGGKLSLKATDEGWLHLRFAKFSNKREVQKIEERRLLKPDGLRAVIFKNKISLPCSILLAKRRRKVYNMP